MSTAIVWFRQDLRCDDNPALTLACQEHEHVIPLYVHDSSAPWAMGGAQRWWLHHSLTALNQSLSAHDLSIILRQGDPHTHLQDIIAAHGVCAVYWNRCYEPHAIVRDTAIKTALKAQDVAVHTSNGSLLLEPWTVKNKSDGYFKVFTPFWKHCLSKIQVGAGHVVSQWPKKVAVRSDHLDDWHLLPTRPNWAQGFAKHWQPGEEGAWHNLETFVHDEIGTYKEDRNIPALNATSKLSPHLHFGEISPQQVWRAVEAIRHAPGTKESSLIHFLSEMGWREFSYHLLYHFPQLPEHNFRAEFNHFHWRQDEHALQAWQKGLTGFPIIDAGMRELWHTGYMHNRVRMIVASFLTKDLLIHWQAGAQWFWDTLVDADLANNSASWQWVAGSGVDAAPYFRVFNPTLQSEKFDPQGEYIRRWVPELAKVANQYIHEPSKAPAGSLPIKLGQDYPYPLVDHAEARKLALVSYQKLKTKAD